MAILDSARYIGSFQSGIHLPADNPLEEVWSLWDLYGSNDYLHEHLQVPGDKKIAVDYIATRIGQSVELRKATRESTLLTAPLTLYYSILNLTRAAIAMLVDVFDSKKHGLLFKPDTEIVSCQAHVTGSGTFIDFLHAAGCSSAKHVQVSLNDCLSRVIETLDDYNKVSPDPPLATAVTVEAYRSGKTFLKFRPHLVGGEEHFRSFWSAEYPSLVTSCDLAPPGTCALRVKSEKEPKTATDVSALCAELLEVNLIPSQHPTWYIIRQTDQNLVWPRPAYYFAGLFILSNIVRYQPESMVDAMAANSKWVWLLRRFLSSAERFYPHLMLNWLNNRVYFFG